MTVNKIGNGSMATIVKAMEMHTGTKEQERPSQNVFTGGVLSIENNHETSRAKSGQAKELRVKYPPLLPIGHTQGIFELDE